MAPPLSDQTFAIIGGTGKTGKWAIKAAIQRGAKVKLLCRTPDKVKGVYATLWPEGAVPEDLAYDKVAESGQLAVVKGSLPIGTKGQKVDDSTDFSQVVNDTDLAPLKSLVSGTTYVMSFLGMDPKNKAPVCRPGIEAIMKAVQESEGQNLKPKIFIMSSICLSDSYNQGLKAWGCCGCVGKFMRWKMLRACFDDMEVAEKYGMDKRAEMGLDLTLLRATVLADKKKYYMDYAASDQPKYYIVKSDELKKVKMSIDRQHVVECFMDAAADTEGKFSNCEWSMFNA